MPAKRMREARSGKIPHHLRPALHLLVQPLQRVGGMKTPAVLLGEVHERQDALGGLLQQLGRGAEPGPEAVRDPVELGQGRGVIGLGEDGPHDGGHGTRGALGHGGQEVAHEVHSTDSHCQLHGRTCLPHDVLEAMVKHAALAEAAGKRGDGWSSGGHRGLAMTIGIVGGLVLPAAPEDSSPPSGKSSDRSVVVLSAALRRVVGGAPGRDLIEL
jgi:hypothetical protein